MFNEWERLRANPSSWARASRDPDRDDGPGKGNGSHARWGDEIVAVGSLRPAAPPQNGSVQKSGNVSRKPGCAARNRSRRTRAACMARKRGRWGGARSDVVGVSPFAGRGCSGIGWRTRVIPMDTRALTCATGCVVPRSVQAPRSSQSAGERR